MTHSTLEPSADRIPVSGKGQDVASLGPSDSTDSGSDVQNLKRHPDDVEDELHQHALIPGEDAMQSDSDRAGTGERASADGDSNLTPNADIRPDHETTSLPPDDDEERKKSKPPHLPD